MPDVGTVVGGNLYRCVVLLSVVSSKMALVSNRGVQVHQNDGLARTSVLMSRFGTKLNLKLLFLLNSGFTEQIGLSLN